MNRDSTIIQVAILFIIIAIIGIAIFQKQIVDTSTLENTSGNQVKTVVVQQVAEGSANTGQQAQQAGQPVTETGANTVVQETNGLTNRYVELVNSPRANVVKQYFMDIANQDYEAACWRLANGKCADRPGAVQNFSREFTKLKNGYEYVSVKDYGITAPSGKEVVCVKYSYRYLDDPNPGLISEVMSFYTQSSDGQTVITDRVCEKKYKDGTGVRPCPIEPNARFCVGRVK